MRRMHPVSRTRRKRQGGQEILEFGLVALLLYIPLFLGSFVVGMNLVKTIQAKNVIRDMADMYIHGADFSDGGYQTLVKSISSGLNLQSPTYSAGTQTRDDTASSGGDGIIWVTRVMYVGSGGGANANNFVFMQRVRIGNTGLITAAHSSITGDPNAALTNSNYLPDGEIDTNSVDPRNNANAKLLAAPQAAMQAMWITPPSPRTALTDGQLIYIVEGFFQTPQFGLGNGYASNGVFARYFF
jgi:hypothetical protein